MKPSSHRKPYPKTGTLTALAAQFRPQQRPVFESEPVELLAVPIDDSRNWRDWNPKPQLRSDFVDRQHAREAKKFAKLWRNR